MIAPGTVTRAGRVREFRGVLIHPQTYADGSGLRYWAIGTGTLLRADTLEGIRGLIRDALEGGAS